MTLLERINLIDKETITEMEAFECDSSLFLEKSSKDFQRSEDKPMIAKTVLADLSETEEAKAFVWDAGNLEVSSQ